MSHNAVAPKAGTQLFVDRTQVVSVKPASHTAPTNPPATYVNDDTMMEVFSDQIVMWKVESGTFVEQRQFPSGPVDGDTTAVTPAQMGNVDRPTESEFDSILNLFLEVHEDAPGKISYYNADNGSGTALFPEYVFVTTSDGSYVRLHEPPEFTNACTFNALDGDRLTYPFDPTSATDRGRAFEAIVAAIAKAGELEVPPGQYTTASRLDFDVAGVTVKAYGVAMDLSTERAEAILVSGSDVKIFGMRIDGEGLTGNAITMTGDCVLEDVGVMDAGQILGGGTKTSNVEAFLSTSGADIILNRTYAQNCTGDHYRVSPGTELQNTISVDPDDSGSGPRHCSLYSYNGDTVRIFGGRWTSTAHGRCVMDVNSSPGLNNLVVDGLYLKSAKAEAGEVNTPLVKLDGVLRARFTNCHFEHPVKDTDTELMPYSISSHDVSNIGQRDITVRDCVFGGGVYCASSGVKLAMYDSEFGAGAASGDGHNVLFNLNSVTDLVFEGCRVHWSGPRFVERTGTGAERTTTVNNTTFDYIGATGDSWVFHTSAGVDEHTTLNRIGNFKLVDNGTGQLYVSDHEEARLAYSGTRVSDASNVQTFQGSYDALKIIFDVNLGTGEATAASPQLPNPDPSDPGDGGSTPFGTFLGEPGQRIVMSEYTPNYAQEYYWSEGDSTWYPSVDEMVLELTDGATITWDVDQGRHARVILGGNRTIQLNNHKKGQRLVLEVLQDGTGGRGLTFSTTHFATAGGSQPTLSSGADDLDVVELYVNGLSRAIVTNVTLDVINLT